jgi:hypothetical protein
METIQNCKLYHDNCEKALLIKLIQALKYTFKVYALTHGVPILIFKLKELKKSPVESLKKYLIAVACSMFFLSGYIMSIRSFHCYIHSRPWGKYSCNYYY